MARDIDANRRRFLGAAAMTIAAAQFGGSGTEANDGEPREWAALNRATEWLNSPRLTQSNLAGKVVLVDFWTYTCGGVRLHVRLTPSQLIAWFLGGRLRS